jgi:uncharacterized membrane protein YeiH
MPPPSTALYVITMLGVAAAAASGALAAGRKNFDLVGIAVISLVTAIGGGTLRDLLLDRHPVFWIRDPNYLVVGLAAAAAILVYSRRRRPPFATLLVADALGLALFAIAGAEIAEQRGHGGIIAIVMGTLTGAAGGVLRDLLCAEVPLLFRPTETLYATAAMAGIAVYLLAQEAGLPRMPAALLGMGIVAGLRFAAIAWRLRLPAVRVREE